MLRRNRIIPGMVAAVLGLGGQAAPDFAQASGMFDMMNPSRWFGGRDRDDYYYGRGYGPYGGGWGGPYGGGWGGPWGWGGPYGWGGGPWGGYGGGYNQPSTIVVTPDSGKSAPPPPAPKLPE
jgi:hypothetical protein